MTWTTPGIRDSNQITVPNLPRPLQAGQKADDDIRASEEIEVFSDGGSSEDSTTNQEDSSNDTTIAETPQKEITIIPESTLSEVKAIFKSGDAHSKETVRQHLGERRGWSSSHHCYPSRRRSNTAQFGHRTVASFSQNAQERNKVKISRKKIWTILLIQTQDRNSYRYVMAQ